MKKTLILWVGMGLCLACSKEGPKAPASQPAPKASETQPKKDGPDHAAPSKPTTDAAASSAKAGEGVDFENLEAGATLFSNTLVKFKVMGKTIKPAGEAPDDPTSGHHHLIIDSPAVAEKQPIPADEKHIHFGKGQSETTLSLAPGQHTLMLQFADGLHRSYGPKWAKTLQVSAVPAPAKMGVSFLAPAAGAKVKSPVKFKFAVEGMKIRPAGEDPKDQTTGHHHLVIDASGVPKGAVIGADDKHIHFGKGQTEAEVQLAPGQHDIQLQFADGLHRSYGEKMKATIKIEVIP